MTSTTSNQGFTLIELIIVIAIIGILAIVAMPKLLNLTPTAQTSATTAIAGALSSASAANYAARKVSNTFGVTITNCTNAANTMQGGLPTGYTITSAAIAADVTATCTLTGPSSSSANFTATGIP